MEVGVTEGGDQPMNDEPKIPQQVAALSVKVLGGTFHVHEVMLLEGEAREDVLTIIRSIPHDRWFVMVSDEEAGGQDSLAMIDDNLEFQIFARGSLTQD